MAVSPSALSAIKRLERIPVAITSGTHAGVVAAAEVLRASAQAELDKVTTGGRLRGVGRRGTKVSVKVVVTGPVGRVYAAGRGFQFIERDVQPHPIDPRPGHSQIMRTPYGPRPRVESPGSHGKHPFEKGVVAGLSLAGAAMEAKLTKSIASALGMSR